MTTFWNPLADPLGTRRGPPLVRGPQFENRCYIHIIVCDICLFYACTLLVSKQ